MTTFKEPEINVGDIVKNHHLDGDLFLVNSCMVGTFRDGGSLARDVTYLLVDIWTLEIAEEPPEDLSVVCDAEGADDLIEDFRNGYIDKHSVDKGMGTFIVELDSDEDEEVVAPSADELLDEMNDIKERIELVGDEDGEYQRRIDVIKDQLADMTDEGGNSDDDR